MKNPDYPRRNMVGPENGPRLARYLDISSSLRCAVVRDLNADLASFSGKTIHAMLKRTAERVVAGSWRTHGYQGNWWLKGSPSQGR